MTYLLWQSPSWVDYSIVGLIALSTIISLMRGFVREALALITWIIAFWVALHYSQLVANANPLVEYLNSKSLRVIAAFLLLLLTTLLIGALINFILSRLIVVTGLGGTDRLLGAFFGIIRGVLLVTVMLLAGQIMNWSKTAWWQNSIVIPHFKELMAWIENFIPAELHAQLQLEHNENTAVTEISAKAEK